MSSKEYYKIEANLGLVVNISVEFFYKTTIFIHCCTLMASGFSVKTFKPLSKEDGLHRNEENLEPI
jgi:hypothetical protein